MDGVWQITDLASTKPGLDRNRTRRGNGRILLSRFWPSLAWHCYPFVDQASTGRLSPSAESDRKTEELAKVRSQSQDNTSSGRPGSNLLAEPGSTRCSTHGSPEKPQTWNRYGIHAAWKSAQFMTIIRSRYDKSLWSEALVNVEPVVPISALEHFAVLSTPMRTHSLRRSLERQRPYRRRQKRTSPG